MALKYEPESMFNMAFAYLKRIDRLLTLCAMQSMAKDITGWNGSLMALYREVSIKLNNNDKKEIYGERITFIDFNNIEIEDCTLRNINFLINHRVYSMTNRKQILFMMHEVEIKLRKHMQSKSMLLPGKDDPHKAITQL